MAEIVDLNSKRPPVIFTVTVKQHYNGDLEFRIAGVDNDERSVESVMFALRTLTGEQEHIDELEKQNAELRSELENKT